MPSRERRIYSRFREELLDFEPFCFKCGVKNSKKSPLHYHHLIPQCLISRYERGFRCTDGILLCRRCHPTESAKQRWEFRRVGVDGFHVYPRNPYQDHKTTVYFGRETREELIAIWKREVKTPFGWLEDIWLEWCFK